MFVVAGVSGNTGSVVAETLLEQGKKVRVIVRDPAKGEAWAERGAEVAVAALDDAGAVTEALRGAQGAYLLAPPDPGAADLLASRARVTDALAAAVVATGIPHVVFLSSIGAHLPAGTGPILYVREGERKLRTTGANVTFLRPAFFLDNWFGSLAKAREEGVLPHFGPTEVAFPQISTLDIGRFGAEALLAPPTGWEAWELAGPQEYTVSQVAAALGEVLGREVKALSAPLEAVVPTFTSFGFSEKVAGLFADMYTTMAAGKLVFESAGTDKPVYESGMLRFLRGTVTPQQAFRRALGG
ncbi:MAG TPA: NmrA family NAD(P)-binding protein [Thermoanaerobaculia bacterium]|nr:NmrA family NAD(P)-binding protein [Thermoanaerobaculia bacterium]